MSCLGVCAARHQRALPFYENSGESESCAKGAKRHQYRHRKYIEIGPRLHIGTITNSTEIVAENYLTFTSFFG